MNWSDFDNYKMKHHEIKNLNLERIQKEIIDKSEGIKFIPDVYQEYNFAIFGYIDFDNVTKFIKNYASFIFYV